MTFNYDGTSFATEFPTSESLQFEWPSLSGMSIESLEVPRMERRRFLEITRPATTLNFDVILHADTEEDAEDAKNRFIMWVDPTQGPRPFILDDDPQWFWEMTVSREINWEKLTWSCEAGGFRWRATVIFESFNDAAARRVGETLASGPIEPLGNTRSWPTVEFKGTLNSEQEALVTIGSHVVRVAGPLTSQDTAILNYDLMRFEVFRAGVKIASLVPRMSTLAQAEVRPQGGPVAFSVVPVSGGTITSALATPNSRKQ